MKNKTQLAQIAMKQLFQNEETEFKMYCAGILHNLVYLSHIYKEELINMGILVLIKEELQKTMSAITLIKLEQLPSL